MKNLIIILLCFVFASCNPFISKDLRQKNKCNRKIEREIKRHKRKVAKIAVVCPDIITEEIIHDTIEVEIPSVKIDSFIVIEKDSSEIDSLVGLIKDKQTREIIYQYIMKYVPFKDTIIHLKDGFKVSFYSVDGNIRYSIDKPKEKLEIPTETIVEIPAPIELTMFEKVMNSIKPFFWWILAAILLLFAIQNSRKIS